MASSLIEELFRITIFTEELLFRSSYFSALSTFYDDQSPVDSVFSSKVILPNINKNFLEIQWPLIFSVPVIRP